MLSQRRIIVVGIIATQDWYFRHDLFIKKTNKQKTTYSPCSFHSKQFTHPVWPYRDIQVQFCKHVWKSDSCLWILLWAHLHEMYTRNANLLHRHCVGNEVTNQFKIWIEIISPWQYLSFFGQESIWNNGLQTFKASGVSSFFSEKVSGRILTSFWQQKHNIFGDGSINFSHRGPN